MRTQDIIIGNTYKHRTSPDTGYAVALEIIRPSKSQFATDIQKEIKVVVVKCAWKASLNDPMEYAYTRYFRPCDLIKF